MKAIISVTGKDNVGIIAGVSTICAEKGANILEHLIGSVLRFEKWQKRFTFALTSWQGCANFCSYNTIE